MAKINQLKDISLAKIRECYKQLRQEKFRVVNENREHNLKMPAFFFRFKN
jgi:hypothetical protein